MSYNQHRWQERRFIPNTLCRNKACVESNTFLFDRFEPNHKHQRHDFKEINAGELHQKHSQIVDDMKSSYLSKIEDNVNTLTNIIYTKLKQNSQTMFHFLKIIKLEPTNISQFSYQVVDGWLKGNKEPMIRSIEKTYEEIFNSYTINFNNWRNKILPILKEFDQFYEQQLEGGQRQQPEQIQCKYQYQEISESPEPIKHDDIYSSEEQNSQDSRLSFKKTKQITKYYKRTKRPITRKMSEGQKYIKKIKKNQRSSEISESSQVVKQRFYIRQEFIQRKQKHILALNTLEDYQQIQPHKLKEIVKIVVNTDRIKDYKINQLLRHTPEIKSITFNTNNPINQYFYNKFPVKLASQMTELYQCWNEKDFFRERQSQIYFPTSNSQIITNQTRHIDIRFWSKFKRLQTLWISNMYDLEKVNQCQNPYDHVKYFRIQPCHCCPNRDYSHFNILSCFIVRSAIKTLIIREAQIDDQFGELLLRFIDRNLNIRNLILEFSKIQPFFIKQIKSHTLAHLTNICLKGQERQRRYQHNLCIEPIFHLTGLKYLTLENLTFIEGGGISQRDPLGFSRLFNLKYLNLYKSNPVYSQDIISLHRDLNTHLKTLILGKTNINYTCWQRIIFLKGLEELNLDGTGIFASNPEKYKYSPNFNLKKLSIQNCNMPVINASNQQDIKTYYALDYFKIMGINACFPRIQYINVVQNHKLCEFDWTKMKHLKFIRASKDFVFKKQQKCENIVIQRV